MHWLPPCAKPQNSIARNTVPSFDLSPSLVTSSLPARALCHNLPPRELLRRLLFGATQPSPRSLLSYATFYLSLAITHLPFYIGYPLVFKLLPRSPRSAALYSFFPQFYRCPASSARIRYLILRVRMALMTRKPLQNGSRHVSGEGPQKTNTIKAT